MSFGVSKTVSLSPRSFRLGVILSILPTTLIYAGTISISITASVLFGAFFVSQIPLVHSFFC